MAEHTFWIEEVYYGSQRRYEVRTTDPRVKDGTFIALWHTREEAEEAMRGNIRAMEQRDREAAAADSPGDPYDVLERIRL